MTPEERPPLLEALARLAYQDAESVDPLTTFLPLAAHRRALTDYVVVVLGNRGSGKTALFKLVNDPRTSTRLRAFFATEAIPEATWIDAFSQSGDYHPEVGTLEQRAKGAEDLTLRAFWMAHLLRRVNDTVPGLVKVPAALEIVLSAPAADLAAWLPVAEANLGAVNAALDATNRALAAAERTVVATYDNLDRLGQFDLSVRRRYISTLLALWLSLTSRYQNLRGKIFLRDDLFDAGELGFADATKLRPKSEALVWDPAALYRVAIRHLANDSEEMRTWLRAMPGLTLEDRGEFGWMPGEMPDEVQYSFGGRLAGKVIGKGVIKSYTSKWIIGRLQDANQKITPRSMLWFLGFAGKAAQDHGPNRWGTLANANDLLTALRQASKERVQEIKEEYDLVARFENLRGMKIPMEKSEVIARLAKAQPGEPAGIPERGDLVFNELCRIGVLRTRDGEHVDVPDIYRYSLEITPDYATAWRDFIAGDDRPTQDLFLRDILSLGESLRSSGMHSDLAKDDIERGDYAAARAKCERALGLFKSASNMLGRADIMIQLGRVSIKQQRYDHAKPELLEAAELYRRTGNPEQETLCYLNLVAATIALNPTAKSPAYALHALQLAQQTNEKSHEATAFFLLAIYAKASVRQDEARTLASIAIQVAARATANEQGSEWSPVMREGALKLGLLAIEIDAHDDIAKAAYNLDRGWSVIHAAFPGISPAE